MDHERVAQGIDHLVEFFVLNGDDHVLDVIEFFLKDLSFMGVPVVLLDSHHSDSFMRHQCIENVFFNVHSLGLKQDLNHLRSAAFQGILQFKEYSRRNGEKATLDV